MPIIKSAKKKVKVAARNRAHNLSYLKKIKEEIKKFKSKPEKERLAKAFSIIDKAAKKKVIHQNKAARLKSKLSKLLKRKSKKSTPKAKK